MNDLTTVPTFTYRQGKLSNDTFKENEIQVSFYNGSIELKQAGCWEQDETINISPEHVKGLFRAIIKNMPEAKEWLDRNTK